MSATSPKTESLRQRWAEALDATEPTVDLGRSRARFLERFESGVAPRSVWAPRAQRWTLTVALAAVVASAVALFVAWPRALPLPSGPTPGAWIEAKASERIPMDFADGSRVMVEPSSRVHVRSVDPLGARVDLEHGSLTASIVPRKDTNWLFHSGPFAVKVTGTELSIDWDPAAQRFEVSVQRGSVRVTGPMLEGGRSVKAGQRCRVNVAESRLEVTPAHGAASDDPALPRVELEDLPLAPAPTPSSSGATGSAELSFVELERQARYDEALAAAERRGLASIYASGSADELVVLARAARLSGRGDVATRALTTCRTRFPGSAAAAQAAFLLGRNAAPAEAARWFSTYLAEAPGGPFAREAAGRLIESYSRAGNEGAARRAAQSYLAHYPTGPHATFARSIIVAASAE